MSPVSYVAFVKFHTCEFTNMSLVSSIKLSQISNLNSIHEEKHYFEEIFIGKFLYQVFHLNEDTIFY